MAERRRTLSGPVALFLVVLVLVVALGVLWNVVLVHDYQRIREMAVREEESSGAFHWTFLSLGSAMVVAIVALLSFLAARLFAEIRFNQQQSHFIASVTHELNSPLSAIKLQAQTLRRVTPAGAEGGGFIDAILEDVERLHRLIANVLRAAQFDARPLRPALEAVDLDGFLADYAAGFATLHAREEGAPEVRVESLGAGVVLLDTSLFRQVLDNLADNAVKYAGAGPCRLCLRTRREGPLRAVVEVEDRGLGIPEGALARVFDRFWRVEDGDPERSRKGTGLGLYIVRTIVEAHGGRVSASSAGRGQGTRIRIELPAVAGEAAAV
ncbi:MAG: HAMP domain-containing histidine kinase [Planctomycetes bacterium]|nr:HAMP domain-containing histidine kinase [Planctomycetota bacterium]